MTLRVYVLDPRLCNGCGSCEMWCSFLHTGSSFSRIQSMIRIIRDPSDGFSLPVMTCSGTCRKQPGIPPCVETCPTGCLILSGAEKIPFEIFESFIARKQSPVFRLISHHCYPYAVSTWKKEANNVRLERKDTPS